MKTDKRQTLKDPPIAMMSLVGSGVAVLVLTLSIIVADFNRLGIPSPGVVFFVLGIGSLVAMVLAFPIGYILGRIAETLIGLTHFTAAAVGALTGAGTSSLLFADRFVQSLNMIAICSVTGAISGLIAFHLFWRMRST